MPNTVLRPVRAATAADDDRRSATAFPYEVRLQGLSSVDLGSRFQPVFDACHHAAVRFGGRDWAVAAVHEPGRTSYVFRFALPLPSLRFAAHAAALLAGRPPHLPPDDAAPP
jgi:hypothetical protein